MSELRNAFQIDGFFEGKTIIQGACGLIHKFEPSKVKNKHHTLYSKDPEDEDWRKDSATIDFYIAKQFKEYKPKEKLYEHEYKKLSSLGDYYKGYTRMSIVTKLSWEEFVAKSCSNPSIYRHLETKEIKEE